MSASHEAALHAIRRSVEERRGFVAIVGPPGVGKTTILNAYLKYSAPPQCATFSLLYPNVSFEEVLQAIGAELGLQDPLQNGSSLMEALRQHLVQIHDEGRVFMMILDEAQHIPVPTLLALLQFSDVMRRGTERLVQMVFLGHPAFEQQLQLPDLQPLREALDVQVTLEPWTSDESRNYIERRLKEAGVPANAEITNETLNHIIERANGIPRVINTLCMEVLPPPSVRPLSPLPEGQYALPSVPRPWEEDAATGPQRRRSTGRRWALSGAVAAVLIASGFWYLPYERLLDHDDHLWIESRLQAKAKLLTPIVAEIPGDKAGTQDVMSLRTAEMESAVLTPITVSQLEVETEATVQEQVTPEPRHVSEQELLTALTLSSAAPPAETPATVEPSGVPTAAESPTPWRQVVAVMQQWRPADNDFALRIVPNPPQSTYKGGETFSARIEAGARAYLYVDYYQANGEVVHLLPNALDSNLVNAGRAFVIGGADMRYRFAFSPPFGEELLTVIASEQPLNDPQPAGSMVEPASAYLPRLAAYFKTHKPNGKVAIAHMVIRTSQGN